MKEFYSTKSKRILKIAEQLILKYDIISFEEIHRFNDCSLRSVYVDVGELITMSEGKIEIDSIHNLLTSSSSSVADLMVLKSIMLKEQLCTQILFLIYFESGKYDIYDLSLKLNYSESHIRAKIQELNIYLSRFQAKIIYEQGYKLVSKREFLLASLIYALIKATMSYELIPDNKNIDELFSSFTIEQNFNFPEILECDLNNILQLYALSNSDFSSYFSLLLDANSNFSEHNFDQIVSGALDAYGFNYTHETVCHIVDILRAMSFKLSITPFLIDNFMNRYDYFMYAFRLENQATCELMQKDIAKLTEVTGIDFRVFESELIFQIYTELVQLRNYKSCTIGVYSDISNKHARSLITTLEKHFSHQQFFLFNQHSDYDLIVSTTSLPQFVDLYEDKAVIVSDFISLKDINNIYKKLYIY